MRQDIQGLAMTKGELKYLSGVSPDRVFRPPTMRKFFAEGVKTFLILGLLLISYFLMIVIFPHRYLLLLVLHVALAIGLIFEDIYRMVLSKKNGHLLRLFDDIERYNAIIQAIHINDKIEAAGNSNVQLKNRQQILEALQLIREDLVRALKTERILRENKKFMSDQSDLFTTNFQALTGLQISDRATEHGRLLNEALDLAVGVQEEMRRLQQRHQ